MSTATTPQKVNSENYENAKSCILSTAYELGKNENYIRISKESSVICGRSFLMLSPNYGSFGVGKSFNKLEWFDFVSKIAENFDKINSGWSESYSIEIQSNSLYGFVLFISFRVD